MKATDWQPIETAPRDKSWVWTYGKDLEQRAARWSAEPDNCWINSDHEVVWVTHWMPLPDPPATPNSGER